MLIKNCRVFTPLEKTKVEVRGKNLNLTKRNGVLRSGRFVRDNSLTGFTLLETLSSVAIFTVIFLLIFGIFASGNRLWLVTDANASNQNEARRAIMDMERKIRGCTDFQVLPVSPAQSSVSFNLNGETIIYEIQESDDIQGTWTKYYIVEITTVGGVTASRRIANDIKSLEFTVDSSGRYDKVNIDIQVRKTTLTGENVDFALSQIAMLRNS